MAPYEQKTDSREFRVANPGPLDATTTDAILDPTETVIRLWGLEGYNRPESLTWQTESSCIYLIADLVSASHGRIAEEADGFMSAQFESPAQALVAARRIQTSILEFLCARPGEAVGAAILIHQPNHTPARYGRDFVRVALAQSGPGQILIPEELSQRWRDIPGLDFRAVDSTASQGGRPSGLLELVWTTPEQIAGLRVSEPREPVRTNSPSIEMAATMMVNVPQAASAEAGPAIGSSEFGSNDHPPAASNSAEIDSPRLIAEEPEHSLDFTGPALTEQLEEESRGFFTAGRIAVGVVALILIAGLITVLYWPVPASKTPKKARQDYAGDAGTPSTTPSVPANPQPDTKTVQQSVEPNLPSSPPVQTKPPEPAQRTTKVVSRSVSPKTPVDSAGKSGKNDKPETAQPPVDVAGWSRKDIPTLLRMARSDIGQGRYDDARIAFLKVLQLQPDNQDAKDGLHKLDLIKGDSDNQ